MSTITTVASTELKSVLHLGAQRPATRRSLFAWITLGIIDHIRRGALSPDAAVDRFFHARNCLYVHRSLKSDLCDDVMGRGTQLPDLFDILPPKQATRALERELTAIESLCNRIINEL